MFRRLAASAFLLTVTVASIDDAFASPARIIVLRHGEKADAYRLCDIGVQRSLALAGRYLGGGSDASLFTGSGDPDAFFVITLHTLKLISPAATTWRKPVIMYSALPQRGQSDADATRTLNERTQEAAADVMTNWSGKTVVMVWEHHHIADEKLARSFPDQKVTLRQLLNLDAIDAVDKDAVHKTTVPKSTVPKTWPGDNYDYFWIVDYDPGSGRPTRFEMIKQSFPAPYQMVPSNDWGAPNALPKGCKD
jgi:hypothetical protein